MYGIARALETDLNLIHAPAVGVVGNKGDSQCYVGVPAKVEAIQARLRERIGLGEKKLRYRLVQPEYTIATSDGIRNGTREMRYSLIGREVTQDSVCEHVSASCLEGTIAVVACDKPPVGTICALLEHNRPSIVMSDGPIHPGFDEVSGEVLDIVSAYQAAGHKDSAYKTRIARKACPGYGSCGGMFTYNTMQIFIAMIGMQPLHMVSPSSDDPVRLEKFPDELINHLDFMIRFNLLPRDIVNGDSIRNAVITAMAIGGSTNVVLHAPEIARAAGFSGFWQDIMTPKEFNHLSSTVVPVLTDARPYGKYSMVDIDKVGGVQVIAKELLNARLINGEVITCTGETLSEQIKRLEPLMPDGKVIYAVKSPFKDSGGLRLLSGNLSPDFSAVLKLAGVEGGLQDNIFKGNARTFDGEKCLLKTLEHAPEKFKDKDVVIVRYEGPSGAPGMPEMLDSTSRITSLCRERGITVALMTDARFSGGSVGLVIGHVGPEAALGGPIAFVEDDDEIVIDLNTNEINCPALTDNSVMEVRRAAWQKAVDDNGGIHPGCGLAGTRLLNSMRESAVPAAYGSGIHPGRKLWISEPRQPKLSGFNPINIWRKESADF
ncbi:MAG: dihydroxy-acid dehydratase [Hyphomicrobiaceae bacterium]|nr:dihydroxy-acid dehydratase [Hyphomicrobiaceae bacterium]